MIFYGDKRNLRRQGVEINKELERLSVELTFETMNLKRTLNELIFVSMELKRTKLDREQINILKQIKQNLDELVEIVEGGNTRDE